jgi:hypothetical protein
MTRTLRTVALAAALGLFGGVAGCASRAPQAGGKLAAQASAATASKARAASESPKVLTSLSSLSQANTLGPLDKQSAAMSKIIGPENPASLARATMAPVNAVRRVGNDKYPGEERLRNDKAARFDRVCIRVMDQLFAAMQELETTDSVERLNVPVDVKPVVITGILNRQGRLTELIIDQHSGEAGVDRMVVEACKKALYIGNPPPEALTPSGDYRMRIEARIESYGSTDQRHSLFKTYIGMALL